MPKIVNKTEALDAITAEIVAQHYQGVDVRSMAEGILGGLTTGYGMDPTAFFANHGDRLAHLTRKTLESIGREVKPIPGEKPRNV